MMIEKREIPLTEKLMAGIWKYCASNRIPLLTAILVGLLTYTFAFTNKLVNWDDISYLFDKGATIDSGRWALPLMSWIFPDYSMPWIYGIVSLVIIAVAVCVLLQQMRIRNPILQALFAGLVIASSSLIGTVMYMFTLSSYAVAFLMAAGAVACANRNSKWYRILGIGLSVFSMGIYQPYIAITSSFFLVLLVRELLDSSSEVKAIVRKGIGYLLHLLIAAVVYYGINSVVRKITGVSYNDYAVGSLSFSRITSLEVIGSIFQTMADELLNFKYALITSPVSRFSHMLCLIVCAGMLVWRMRKESGARIALLAAILILLPISINCILLISHPSGVHTLVVYSFIAVYGLICVILENGLAGISIRKRNCLLDIVTIALSVVVVCNVYAANKGFLQAYLSNRNAEAFYTSLVTRVSMHPSFSDNTKIALIGEADQYLYDYAVFSDDTIPSIMGLSGMVINEYSRPLFLKYYLGFAIEYASREEIEMILDDPAFAAMPVYPYEGSVQRFGDIMVVKFSDPTQEPESDEQIEE